LRQAADRSCSAVATHTGGAVVTPESGAACTTESSCRVRSAQPGYVPISSMPPMLRPAGCIEARGKCGEVWRKMHVLPFILIAFSPHSALLALGVAMSWWPRVFAVARFRQPLDSAILHPLGVLVLLAVQWYALSRHLLHRPSSWKGRAYVSGPQQL
jgi:hypothetical protein